MTAEEKAILETEQDKMMQEGYPEQTSKGMLMPMPMLIMFDISQSSREKSV